MKANEVRIIFREQFLTIHYEIDSNCLFGGVLVLRRVETLFCLSHFISTFESPHFLTGIK